MGLLIRGSLNKFQGIFCMGTFIRGLLNKFQDFFIGAH